MSRVILRSALRIITGKRLETISVALLVFISILSISSIAIMKENMKNQVYELFGSATGDLLVLGLFNDTHLELVKRVDGVLDVAPYRVLAGVALVGGERIQVSIVGHETIASIFRVVVIKEGRLPGNANEATLYSSIRGPIAKKVNASLGDGIEVVAFNVSERKLARLNATLVGLAEGFNHIGRTPYVLIMNENLVRGMSGESHLALRILIRGDVKTVSENVLKTLRDNGVSISWYFINIREENPVNVLIEGLMGIFTLPLIALLLIAPAMSASIGLASVARDYKLVAVMKSIGFSSMDLFIYYSLPWIIRGLLGAIPALIVSPYVAKWLYVYFMGGAYIAELLYEAVGFKLMYDVAFRYTIIALALLALGSLVPLVLAYRIDIVKSISFIGLYAGETLRILSGFHRFLWFKLWLRNLTSGRWKLITTVILLAILWGLQVSSSSLGSGALKYSGLAQDREYNPVDIIGFVYAADPSIDLLGYISRIMGEVDSVSGYHVTLQYTLGVGVEGLSFVFLRATIAGDPSIEYPLEAGRYPEREGEVVISRSLAMLKGYKVGDKLRLVDGLGRIWEFKITGISRALQDRGSYLLLTESDIVKISGLRAEEFRGLGLAIRLKDGLSIEYEAEKLRGILESVESINVEYYTRHEVSREYSTASRMIQGVTGIISIIALISVAVALSSINIVESQAKMREIAVLKALGVPPSSRALETLTQTIAIIILSTPIAYATSYITAKLLARETATFFGYIEPEVTLNSLITSNTLTILIVVTVIITITVLITTSRLNTVRALADL
ncbi:MAG: FtsX-like permease family protein [Acidilobaceae archaeon]